MRRVARLMFALGCLGLSTSCDDWIEREPRVTPAAETLWLLVDLQLKLDALRPVLEALDGRSFSPELVDRLTGEVALAAEALTSGPAGPDRLRATRYRADLVSVGYDFLRVDAEAKARGLSGAFRSSSNTGVDSIWKALDEVDEDALWPVSHAEEADRVLLGAVGLRNNALRAAPVANVMKTGVHAVAITGGALSAVQLTRSGLPILARLAGFVRSGGGAPAMLEAGFAGGAGGVRVVMAGQSIALSVEEVIKRLRDAIEGTTPHTPECQAALKKALRGLAAEIRTPGTRLNNLITGAVAE